MEHQCVKLTHKLKNNGITSLRKYLRDHVMSEGFFTIQPLLNDVDKSITS